MNMRWLWIDRFLEFERGKSARAVKNLSLAEDLFADHFPGYPVMPAALMLEGLAQTGGILVGEANDFKEKVVLAKIVWARFPREAVAGRGAGLRRRDPDACGPRGLGPGRVYAGRRGRRSRDFVGAGQADSGRGGDLLRPPGSRPARSRSSATTTSSSAAS